MSTLQVTLTGALGGFPVNNVLGVETTNTVTAHDCDLIARVVFEDWGASVLSVLSQQLSLTKADCINLNDTSIGGVWTGNLLGSVPGAVLPTFVCAKVQWATALRGRAFRGRTGLCGILEDWTETTVPNQLKATPQSNLQEAMDEFLAQVNTDLEALTNLSDLAVVSQTHNGVPRNPVIGTPITSVHVPPALGTRRGRM